MVFIFLSVLYFVFLSNHSKADTYVEDLKEIAGEYNEELAQMYPATDDDEAKVNIYELYGVAWFDYSHHTWSDYLAAQDKDALLFQQGKWWNRPMALW